MAASKRGAGSPCAAESAAAIPAMTSASSIRAGRMRGRFMAWQYVGGRIASQAAAPIDPQADMAIDGQIA
jgi:hypothetical protein